MTPSSTTLFATLAMLLTQINAAIVVLGYKYIVNRGVSLRIIVAYRLILATILLIPTTLLSERLQKPNEEEKKKLNLSWKVFIMSFLCGLFGGSLGSNLFVASLKLYSTTSSTAISNLSPAVTFILALIFRLEKLEFNKWSGRAKTTGTFIVVIGAMILTFYKGSIIQIWPATWQMGDTSNYRLPMGHSMQPRKHDELVGTLLALATSISSSVSLVIQDKLLEKYPSRMRTTTLINGMGAVQSAFFAGVMDRESHLWRLDSTIVEVILVYAAFTASGLMMLVTAWSISKKGSLFVSVFSPIILIVVAIFSPLILGEPLHMGSMVGAIIILCGIYLVIWGKNENTKEMATNDLQQGEEIETVQNIQQGQELKTIQVLQQEQDIEKAQDSQQGKEMNTVQDLQQGHENIKSVRITITQTPSFPQKA